MKGEEANLFGLLREFWSVKMKVKHFCLCGLELDGYQTPSCVGDISDNDTIKIFDRKYDLLEPALSQQK